MSTLVPLKNQSRTLPPWPARNLKGKQVLTVSHLAMSPSPCLRHSMVYELSPRLSHQLPSMRKSPTQASRTVFPRPVVPLLDLIESWKVAYRRARHRASLQTAPCGLHHSPSMRRTRRSSQRTRMLLSHRAVWSWYCGRAAPLRVSEQRREMSRP
ncbi:mahogunin, ring finger 1, isoform CRA_b [Mus musculus]|nr:mahogunin, ring finger 1, isoform CRA_b [Mus musculus]